MALKLTLSVALLALCCAGQQLAGNYVDDYDYQDVPQRPAQRPPQRAPQPQRPIASSPLRQNTNVPRPTPVPILKQINRHNEDGSYTYGYEGADGTFKIETKFPTGDVKGKYGFVDDTGKVRVVEYGADRYGFQPAGEGITVAPPTLVDETTRADDLPEDDGYYVEKPRPQRPQPQQRPRPTQPPPPPPRYQQDNYEVQTRFQNEPQYSHAPAPRPKSPAPPRQLVIPGASPVSQGGYSAPPRPRPQPQQQPARAFQPAQQQQQHFGPQQFANRPSPPQQHAHQHAPQHAPQHSSHISQQPQYHHVQQSAPPQSGRSSGSGILDQLAKDYALPQGAGAPLHDISFGYY